ncbi:MAG: murein biosynthesis integral membrane protein MurJ [Alphaproteobacteria bacterium]|nr:murein biosynthesis integral membrane protein MurJ [Alphaproteobacteria bacterium]
MRDHAGKTWHNVSMKFFKAIATVAGLTLLSRLAGFVRDILTAALLGAGPLADAFFVALKLPNFFRRISAEGAFTVAFVPVYTGIKEARGQAAAAQFSAHILLLMASILGIFVTLAVLAMPYIVALIAPGFDRESERFAAAVLYCRITFPYLLLISITAMFGAMLNAHNRFAPFAIAPVLFNATLIAAMLTASWQGWEVANALSFGITLSGIIQLGFMALMVFKNKIQPHYTKFTMSDDVKKVFALMGPGVLGAGVMHINLFADMIIASFLPVGAISALYYADRLNQLPLGVVGIAMGTALLPMLSTALAKKAQGDAKKLFAQAIEGCIFLALPSALGLFVLAEVIISVLFERGAFDSESTQRAAYCLMGYCIGLVPYVASKVLSTVYWANKDTWTPVKISMVTTALNIALSIALIFPFKEAGIALSTGIVGWLQFFLLKRRLKQYEETHLNTDFIKRIIRLVLSAFIMAGVVYMVSFLLSNFVNDVVLMLVAIGSGIITYITAVFLLRIYNIRAIKHIFIKPQK